MCMHMYIILYYGAQRERRHSEELVWGVVNVMLEKGEKEKEEERKRKKR